AEHDTAVLGGGGMAEQSSAWLGGGGMAEQSSAWPGGCVLPGQSSAWLGGGGITEHDTVFASDSIPLWCALPGPASRLRSRPPVQRSTPRPSDPARPVHDAQIPPASSEVHTTSRVRSPRNRSRANSSGSPDRA